MDESGQAVTIDYTYGLAIAVVLITLLLLGGGNFIAEQQAAAARAELEVLGQQLAADIEAADRLVVSGDQATSVRLQRQLPQTVAGSTYDVALMATADPYLRLSSTDPERTVRVEFANMTAVGPSHVDGGPIRINYTAADRLAVEAVTDR